MLELNLPPFEKKITQKDGNPFILDVIRRQYVALTPEEWVRRHLVAFLTTHCGATLHSVVEEYPVNLNNMAQRADVVVMDNNSQPVILAECKSPDVNLGNKNTLQEVFAQATRYNAVVQARYIIITNGLRHYCYEYTEAGYAQLTSFPKMG